MDCIFCSIANKSLFTRIVYEDSKTVAFLDITPRSRGMCLVIPKKHIEEFENDAETAKETFHTALIVKEKIEKSLKPLAVFMSVMPSQVPHAHIRVYPVYEKEIPLIENKPLTLNDAELDELAKKIKQIDVKKPEKQEVVEKPVVKEEKPAVKDDVKEDSSWIKRHFEVA
ncbi:MAG: HIT domain-containing protein [Candidatus Aenigmatarchaeota archaeon]|nr:HIT domain-containing protein [Candidatus Aenigmarchaeota archaeon]